MTLRADAVNILLVDDQPAKLLTYRTILEDLGETLLTASSATEALASLLKHDVAVVLVDVCMPDFDGYELATLVRQHPRCQQTSIIFVSAVLMTELDRLRGYECGGVDYVPVPVVPEILRAKVSVFADLYRKTRALERLNHELEQRVAERTAQLEATTASLREASQRKDEFLAMLAHEIRNPLAPIRTAVHLLKRSGLGDLQRQQARDVIERQVEHLVCLIDDLLDVSRITRGLINLQREPLTLEAVLVQAIETARPSIDARRHDLDVSLPDDVIGLEGDKTRLVQVFANLLQNAAKFSPAGGRICVSADRDGDAAVVRVTDYGIGLRAEQIPRIFDLFAQVHGPAEAVQGGLGIGLALVKRLTEMHGGSVHAHSDGPGLGTVMTVRLPALSAAALTERLRRAGSPLANGTAVAPCRVLVVDDNHDAAESLAILLSLSGHVVDIAADGPAALEIAERFRPHVVLLDLGMPAMDGYDVARQLRRTLWGRKATIVAVTGWGQPEDRARTARSGFDAHLVKPVSDADLNAVLARAGRDRGGE